MLKTGQKAPSLILKTVEGQEMALADMWSAKQQNVVLVFLRHLG